MLTGQASLNNFYRSIQFNYPQKAEDLKHDLDTVGLYALLRDKTEGQAAADRLRRQTMNLPEIYRRVLGNTLLELGYS